MSYSTEFCDFAEFTNKFRMFLCMMASNGGTVFGLVMVQFGVLSGSLVFVASISSGIFLHYQDQSL